ncbi:MAG TPA: signal peptidase II, partial [Marinobacter hydrocarbonoclasticus]|nr:signal peptidase II [Marinobacter nauticus]
AFNLADIAIVLGTVLFLYVSFIPEKSGTNVELDGSG